MYLIIVPLISLILLIPISILIGKLDLNEGLSLALFFLVGYLLVPVTLLKLLSPRVESSQYHEVDDLEARLLCREYQLMQCVQILGLGSPIQLIMETSDGSALRLSGDFLSSFLFSDKQAPSERLKIYFDEEFDAVHRIEFSGEEIPFSALAIDLAVDHEEPPEFELLDRSFDELLASSGAR
ncbi:hypothetical protein NBRC116583_18030 [Arenicella sp. 4NH20-0111]|uniref:hypothetical protein n=1 Tax=Arenicella sp. 4NH20-0111 TaxID=3127648 RepID=UPI003106CFDF